MHTITADFAQATGLRPLTTPIHIERERDIIDSICRTLRKGRIRFARVRIDADRVEIWRSATGWIETGDARRQQRHRSGVSASRPDPNP